MTERIRIIYVNEPSNRARVVEYAHRESSTPRAASRQFYASTMTRDDIEALSTEFAWNTLTPESITQQVHDFISDSTMEIWCGECPFPKQFPDYTGHNDQPLALPDHA